MNYHLAVRLAQLQKFGQHIVDRPEQGFFAFDTSDSEISSPLVSKGGASTPSLSAADQLLDFTLAVATDTV